MYSQQKWNSLHFLVISVQRVSDKVAQEDEIVLGHVRWNAFQRSWSGFLQSSSANGEAETESCYHKEGGDAHDNKKELLAEKGG